MTTSNLAHRELPEHERALEISLAWGELVLETRTVRADEVVTIGDRIEVAGVGPFRRARPCDFSVPARALPDRRFPLAVSQSATGAAYLVNVHDSFGGALTLPDGRSISLEAARQWRQRWAPSDLPQTEGFLLEAEETLCLSHGSLTLTLRYVPIERVFIPPLLERLNYAWVNAVIFAMFIHLVAVSVFASTPRVDEEMLGGVWALEPHATGIRFIKPEQPKPSILQGLKEGEAAARAKGDEGKAGRPDFDRKKKGGRIAVKGDPKKSNEELVKDVFKNLFGTKGDARSSPFMDNGGAFGEELQAALGNVKRAEVADAFGDLGLGTRGKGPGGGGDSLHSIGLRGLETKGRFGGGPEGVDYGDGLIKSRLGTWKEGPPIITEGTPRIEGSLDRELIRQVVNSHKAQIRYCYERELVRQPGLFGKVATVWTIGPTGHVVSASVKSNDLDNEAVGQCIVSKIRRWKFPAPKGGGVVVVNYPFVLKTSG